MAMTGALIGDFSSFQTAVDGSIVKLTKFEDGANKAGVSLDKATNALSGVKIVQQAAIAAEAVERIGGVSKLTEAELARVGATATEAVAKLKAMGDEVPPKIQGIADAFKESRKPIEDLSPPTEGFGARVTGVVAAGAAAKEAIQGLIAIGVQWVSEVIEQENASARLETALRNQGTAAPVVAAQYAALAEEFDQTTVFAGALITEMEAMLVTVGGVLPKDMKAALTASTDLAAGLRIDLTSATDLVAKALDGNFAGLKKRGIDIDELAFKTRGAAVVFEAIAATMGGQATSQAATLGGELTRLQKVVSNAEQSLGGLIAKGLKPAVDLFMALPTPVREGVVVVGLLAGAAGTLAVAVAGVSAAVAIAVPLLGFSSAAAGVSALGALTIGVGAFSMSLGTAAAFVGTLGLAIGTLVAGYALGTWLEQNTKWGAAMSDAIGHAALMLGGMSAAEAGAAIAGQRVTEEALKQAAALKAAGIEVGKVKDVHASYADQLAAVVAQVHLMTAAQKAEVLAAKDMGATDDEIWKQLHVNATAVNLLTKERTDALAATKKAVTDLAAAQKEQDQAAIAGLSGQIAGMKSLEAATAKAYGTQAQIDRLTQLDGAEQALYKSVYATIDSEKERMKIVEAAGAAHRSITEQKMALEGKLKDVVNGSVVSELAALGRVNEAMGLRRDGTLQVVTAESILQEALAELDKEDVKGLQTTQRRREAYFQYSQAVDAANRSVTALTSSTITSNDEFRKSVEQNKSVAQSFQLVTGAVQGTRAEMDALAETSRLAYQAAGFITHLSLSGILPPLPGGTYPRAAGGPVSAGGSYLVGERGPELFVPTSGGSIVPAGGASGRGVGGGSIALTVASGAVVLNFPIMNDPTAKHQIAALVGDALMARMKALGLRLPSGA